MSANPVFAVSLLANSTMAVHLSEYAETRVIGEMAMHRQQVELELAELRKTYHLGTRLTPGRGYDDRLTMRTGLCRATLMLAIEQWRAGGGKRGGLQHICGGKKYIVTEEACRNWLKARS
jgi:hypothetical protein